MQPPPVGLERLRAALATVGAAPLKRHGQHFLLDENLLAAIVRDAGVRPGETVLEVGPGPGLLTRHLLAAGARVLAIEIDPAMEAVARQLIEAEWLDRLEWFTDDVLRGSRRLAATTDAALERSDRLVANLPYNIAGPLLASVVAHPAAPASGTVMVQREVGERLVTQPGGRDWGPLSVWMALCTEARLLRRVPGQAFWPAPRVESVVIGWRLKAERPDAEGRSALAAFLPLAFGARRKRLVNAVAKSSGRPAAEIEKTLKIAKNQLSWRAEAFSELELLGLALHWANHAPGTHDRPRP